MDDIHKIKECLRELAGFAPIETEVAKVLSVDGAACKVSRVRDGMVIDKVRLNAITTSDKGVVVVPKTDSFVLINRIGESSWFVSLCGDVERITIDAETEIVINGGGYGGLIKIDDLVDELNRLVQTFNTHTHEIPDGTSGTPIVQASRFHKSTLENTKIKHGE